MWAGRRAGRVASEVRSASGPCQINSKMPMSSCLPLTVSRSISRTRARSNGDSASAVCPDKMTCSPLASATIRDATLTESPNTSPSTSIAGPKWKPTRIASRTRPTAGCSEIRACISAAASAARSAAGRPPSLRRRWSSPLAPSATRTRSGRTTRQRSIVASATASPTVSYNRVLPLTSAKSTASSELPLVTVATSAAVHRTIIMRRSRRLRKQRRMLDFRARLD